MSDGSATHLPIAAALLLIACRASSAMAGMGSGMGNMAAMQMNDRARFGALLIDQLEWRHDGSRDLAVWEGEGWYGGDYDKLWLRTEGTEGRASDDDVRVELLWDRILTRWWNLQAGAREDAGTGPARTWAAVGLRGLAPQWFEVEATLYVGDAGRTAARVRLTNELLLTQRWIVEPEAEANLYGHADPARHRAAGLSDLDIGVRLRYEISRESGPYVGTSWSRHNFAEPGSRAPQHFWQLVAGVRLFL